MRLILFLALLALALPAWAQAPFRLTSTSRICSGHGEVAQQLAELLNRITGRSFRVEPPGGPAHEPAIYLGLASELPAMAPPDWKQAPLPHQREEYSLRSHSQGLWLIARHPRGLEHALWDLAYRLGYRQYFPGSLWEVCPRLPDPVLAVQVQERPQFWARRIWYSGGALPQRQADYLDWCKKNRLGYSIELNTAHYYQAFIQRNKAVFQAHPEYYGLRGGKRNSPQLCLSNPTLRQLLLEDGRQRVQQSPQIDSISMEPADGDGWCECLPCQGLGPPSDRAMNLASQVCEAVQPLRPGLRVGVYAYNQHCSPPSKPPHPQVVVSVATAFTTKGWTTQGLLKAWRPLVKEFGIREYLSINTWSRDLPAEARAANLKYLDTCIPSFAQMGARYYSGEAGDNWAPNGLGYFLLARYLWDPEETKSRPQLQERFLSDLFGRAKGPMKEFYAVLDGSRKVLMSDSLVGSLYTALAKARQAEPDPLVQQRLEQLLRYVYYVECLRDYQQTRPGPARQAAMEKVMRLAWSLGPSGMVHAKMFYRDLPVRDKSVQLPAEVRWDAAAPNPWQQDPPPNSAQLNTILQQGLAKFPVFHVKRVSYSQELVPAAPLGLTSNLQGSFGIYTRSQRDYFTLFKAGESRQLRVKGGYIFNGLKGPIRIALETLDPEAAPESQVELPADRTERVVTLTAKTSGLHRLVVRDGGDGTSTLEWLTPAPLTVVSPPEGLVPFFTRWSLCFYVPRGTREITGYSGGHGQLRDPQGKTVYQFPVQPEMFRVAVPAGQDGRLWSFFQCLGGRALFNLPPCLARSPQELLLPREVVERDRPKS